MVVTCKHGMRKEAKTNSTKENFKTITKLDKEEEYSKTRHISIYCRGQRMYGAIIRPPLPHMP